MKHKWTAADWSLLILTSTVPLTIMTMAIMRALDLSPVDQASNILVVDFLQYIIGGVIGIIGTVITYQISERKAVKREKERKMLGE